MNDIRLETKRLILRKFEESDTDKCFVNFGQDKSLGTFLRMYPIRDIENMRMLINGFVQAYEKDAYIWLVEEKNSGEPIGYISIDIPYPELGIGEICYLLGSRYQKKGYATESLSAVIDYMLNFKKLYMIEAKYNEQNTASGNLLMKIGFKRDGILRGRRINLKTGERCNLIVCSVTKED